MTTRTVMITTLNQAPTADAGSNQSVSVGAMVTLDGSGSFDPVGPSATNKRDYTMSRPG